MYLPGFTRPHICLLATATSTRRALARFTPILITTVFSTTGPKGVLESFKPLLALGLRDSHHPGNNRVSEVTFINYTHWNKVIKDGEINVV